MTTCYAGNSWSHRRFTVGMPIKNYFKARSVKVISFNYFRAWFGSQRTVVPFILRDVAYADCIRMWKSVFHSWAAIYDIALSEVSYDKIAVFFSRHNLGKTRFRFNGINPSLSRTGSGDETFGEENIGFLWPRCLKIDSLPVNAVFRWACPRAERKNMVPFFQCSLIGLTG